ncbi:FMN-linked oxidoreductase [Tothia fuscella]|uniref:FMN-linked oxidoreductase n=1 Tax=Tothia fuscella TaxID=1048955 RepID=A0A9P4NIN7_9PEZI|nr:FMN-linked oxidoreductase [Tothia fuscella]
MFKPYSLGGSISLRNRIVMQSMTRNRCNEDNMPGEAVVQHYAERARDGAGLIITEGTFIWLNGSQWLHTPVMFNESHARAWHRVTDAVHEEGGKIFMQAWHPGAFLPQNENMPLLKESGYPIWAPSSIPATGGKYREPPGIVDHTINITVITKPEEIIEHFRNSVNLANQAGFDGIEILAQGCSNHRTDKYGGSTENRCRFVLEVVDTILEVWDPSALSETYNYLIPQLVSRNFGYVNISRRGSEVNELPAGFGPLDEFGPLVKFPGSHTALMVNHENTVGEAEVLLQADKIDLIGFGRPFIHNSDLVTRILRDIPLALNDRGGIVYYGPYQQSSDGYNDWSVATHA